MESNTQPDSSPENTLAPAKKPRKAKAEKAPKTPRPAKKTKEKKAAKPKKLTPWKKMAPGDAAQAFSTSAHYTAKSVNSNAAQVGIRLGRDDRSDLPYVSYSSLNVNRHITDYTCGAGQCAMFSQAAASLTGNLERYVNIDFSDVERVPHEVAVLDEPFAMGTQVIDARLRQVYFPVPSDEGIDHVSLTPLHSSPFSLELSNRLDAEREAGDVAYRRRASMKYGGDKPQNVGRLTAKMYSVLVFAAPEANPALRNALSIFYRGVTMRSLLPTETLSELRQWRLDNRVDGDGSAIKSTLKTRSREEAFLVSIAKSVLKSAEEIARLQKHHIDTLGGVVHEDAVSPGVLGLLDSDKRNDAWARNCAIEMIDAIVNYRSNFLEDTISSDGEFDSLVRVIEECLQ